MKKNKIIIEVRGGVVECITANEDLDIILVDYDNAENDGNNDRVVSAVYSPDRITDCDAVLEFINEQLNEEEYICHPDAIDGTTGTCMECGSTGNL